MSSLASPAAGGRSRKRPSPPVSTTRRAPARVSVTRAPGTGRRSGSSTTPSMAMDAVPAASAAGAASTVHTAPGTSTAKKRVARANEVYNLITQD